MSIDMRAQIHPPLGPVRAAWLLVTRSYIVYKKNWKLFLTGFFEPVFSCSRSASVSAS